MGIHSTFKTGVISSDELLQLLETENDNVKILDASFVLPGADTDPFEEFQKSHIEGAQFFDIKAFADPNSTAPHMLCCAEDFSEKISAMGISNDDHVVIYGQSGMIMGPARAWWSFKIFGHENVAVLDGGLPAWLNKNLPVTSEPTRKALPSQYQARFQPQYVRNIEEVDKASQAGEVILDARPAARFSGETPEPRAEMRSGHIPGSYSLPCSSLVSPETGCLRSADELSTLFSDYIPPQNTDSIILSCGSGVTACALALGLHSLEHNNWSVYDGSWSEWGHTESGKSVETGQNTPETK